MVSHNQLARKKVTRKVEKEKKERKEMEKKETVRIVEDLKDTQDFLQKTRAFWMVLPLKMAGDSKQT